MISQLKVHPTSSHSISLSILILHRLSRKLLIFVQGGGGILSYYKKSVIRALLDLFPDIGLSKERLQPVIKPVTQCMLWLFLPLLPSSLSLPFPLPSSPLRILILSQLAGVTKIKEEISLRCMLFNTTSIPLIPKGGTASQKKTSLQQRFALFSHQSILSLLSFSFLLFFTFFFVCRVFEKYSIIIEEV